jgi:hypothetical protein
VSAACAEVFDDENEVADVDCESELEVGAVAAQLFEDDDDDEEVEEAEEDVDVASVVSLPLCVVSVGLAVDAAVLSAWTAITPPRPSSAATLAEAAAFRARRAGCGRVRRVASGITRSFDRGPSHRPGRR